MAINVRGGDRDQQFLMPPSVADWLPDGHLAWFVVDVVAELDLTAFYADYREDGRGGAAYDPALMLGTLLYAYCVGERSSRRIEATPQSRTWPSEWWRPTRPRPRHPGAVPTPPRRGHRRALRPGARAVRERRARGCQGRLHRRDEDGGQRVGLVEPDAQATGRGDPGRGRTVDRAEDERFGRPEGTSFPSASPPVRTAGHGSVRPFANSTLRARRTSSPCKPSGPGAKPRRDANSLDESPNRAGARAKERLANTTDPDSRMLRARNHFVQGYNAQAAVSTDQVIVAAEVTNAANDTTMLIPMVSATEANLAAAVRSCLRMFVADTGYWSGENLAVETTAELLIPPLPITRGN